MSDEDAAPPVVIAYGDSGKGKTTDLLYSFPNALFIPIHADALRPSETVCGYRPRPDQVQPQRRLSQAIGLLTQVANAQKREGRQFYPQVVVDDLSLLADGEELAMDQSGKYPKAGDGAYRKWGDIRALVQEFCDIARHEMGCTVAMNAHPRASTVDKKTGQKFIGGPKLPSKTLTGAIPFIATEVYQVGIEPGRKPYPTVYQVYPADTDWATKSRLNYFGRFPMNMAELLRQANAGQFAPRHPGLEWTEAWVEAVAQKVAAGESRSSIFKRVSEHPQLAGKNSQHIAWILRDGFDRADIRKMRSNSVLSAFA